MVFSRGPGRRPHGRFRCRKWAIAWRSGSIRRRRYRSPPGRKRPTPPIRCRSCRRASSTSRVASSTPAHPGTMIGRGGPSALDAAVLVRIPNGGEERRQGWLRRVLRHAECEGFHPEHQEGYDVTTTNPVSTDFGQTWLLGDPRRGILPLVDPFPVRPNGSRYQNLVGSSLGADTILAPGGGGYTAENPNRVHSRVQRWRVGW